MTSADLVRTTKGHLTQPSLSLPRTRMDLNHVLLRSVTIERSTFHCSQIHIHNDLPRAEVKADVFLERLFCILLENAAIHNPREDTQVWVNVESRADGFLITVGDSGPGIPDSIRGSLFDPTRRPGGFGLLVGMQQLHQSWAILDIVPVGA